jgi:ABC-2 type transport system ATP-binding protein
MIKINDVTKRYEKKTAVSNVSLQIDKGQIHGLIGENSAGKTTLIKCIVGIYTPDEGSITLDGNDVYDNLDAKKRIAYVGDYAQFVPFYTVASVLKMYTRFYDTFSIEKFNKYNEIYNIPLKSVANNLSKGQKMRLNIMLEMAKGAEYIIMDEPASGLDPIAKTQFFDMLIREVEENGTGIFISSHNLQSLEKICDVITVMHQGEIESNVAVNELKSKIKRAQAVFEKGVSDEDLVNAGFEHVSHTGSIYTMNSKEDEESIKEKLKTLGASFIEVTDLSLEEYFIALGENKEQ